MERATGLEYFNPIFFRGESTKAGSRQYSTMLLGVGPYHQEVANHWVDRGRFFSDLDIQRSARVCMVGQEVIDELELSEPILGTDLIVGSSAFTIVGIMEYQGEMLGQNQDDFVLIPITTARDIYGVEAFKKLRLDFQAESPETVDQARDQMREILRERHRLPEGMRDDFRILLQEELLDTISGVLATVTSVVAGIVSIALLVGGIGIMNIMLVSVTERTREIGVRKAVGARRSDILVQFLIEAVTICLVGGLLGVLGGWGLGILGAKAIPGFPPAHVPLWAIALGFGFAALVGIFFGTYPAAKASTLDPIEANSRSYRGIETRVNRSNFGFRISNLSAAHPRTRRSAASSRPSDQPVASIANTREGINPAHSFVSLCRGAVYPLPQFSEPYSRLSP
jgi:putative ABC transport system permease protein